jgi:hypothetical protein
LAHHVITFLFSKKFFWWKSYVNKNETILSEFVCWQKFYILHLGTRKIFKNKYQQKQTKICCWAYNRKFCNTRNFSWVHFY